MKTVIWKNLEWSGIEYMRLSFMDNHIDVESTVIQTENNIPNKVTYHISLDTQWVVKEITIEIDHPNKSLHLLSNGKGQWFDEQGDEIHELEGAIDMDISCTPFTNSLPINRLEWIPHVAKDLEMVYITVPDLTYKKVIQSYTLTNDSIERRVFHFKDGVFEANVEFDRDGLVNVYPGLFTRQF